MLAQLSTAGFILPMYLYVLHVRTRPSALVGAATQYGQHSKLALAVLPTVALTFYVPHFNSFLRPDLTTRHWWNWIWQAFPVWGFGGVPAFYVMFSILFGLLQRLPKSLSIKVQRQTRSKAMRLTAVSIGMINVATYWYTMGKSGFSWKDIYVPRRWVATSSDPEEVLGLLIQADGICSFGSTITWLAFQIWDLKTMGLMRMSWARIVLAAVAIMAMFGPGALCWVGWMAREEMLASMASESSRPAHEKKVA